MIQICISFNFFLGSAMAALLPRKLSEHVMQACKTGARPHNRGCLRYVIVQNCQTLPLTGACQPEQFFTHVIDRRCQHMTWYVMSTHCTHGRCFIACLVGCKLLADCMSCLSNCNCNTCACSCLCGHTCFHQGSLTSQEAADMFCRLCSCCNRH